jgi:hypothetical protein
VTSDKLENFFQFWSFLIIILEMNPVKHFFKSDRLTRLMKDDATYEGVVPVHIARLKGLAHARVATLVGIVSRRVS